MRMFATLFLLVASSSSASAAIRICNEFDYLIHFAFAYETKEGWVTDGWSTIKPNSCEIDSKHPDLTSFYYRGETDPIKLKDGSVSTWSWGSNRAFSVPQKGFDDFKYANAETKAQGARLAEFNGPDTFKKPTTLVTLTFHPDLKVTFTTPKADSE